MVSYVSRIACCFFPVLGGVFSRFSGFPASTKCDYKMSSFDLRSILNRNTVTSRSLFAL